MTAAEDGRHQFIDDLILSYDDFANLTGNSVVCGLHFGHGEFGIIGHCVGFRGKWIGHEMLPIKREKSPDYSVFRAKTALRVSIVADFCRTEKIHGSTLALYPLGKVGVARTAGN